MDVKHIIKTIKEQDLLEFFFELEEDYFWAYDREDENGDLIQEPEDIENYLSRLGLNNYEDKGGRADTSEFWNVVYFPDHDVYIKISGEYDSYGQYEHEYNTITEVKPKQVTKTIYE